MDEPAAVATDKYIDLLETEYIIKLRQYTTRVKQSYRSGAPGHTKVLNAATSFFTKPNLFPDTSGDRPSKRPAEATDIKQEPKDFSKEITAVDLDIDSNLTEELASQVEEPIAKVSKKSTSKAKQYQSGKSQTNQVTSFTDCENLSRRLLGAKSATSKPTKQVHELHPSAPLTTCFSGVRETATPPRPFSGVRETATTPRSFSGVGERATPPRSFSGVGERATPPRSFSDGFKSTPQPTSIEALHAASKSTTADAFSTISTPTSERRHQKEGSSTLSRLSTTFDFLRTIRTAMFSFAYGSSYFRQKTTFSAKVLDDKFQPTISDVKLLPGGLILLADESNRSVKLFDTQGHHIVSGSLVQAPVKLAVMEDSVKHQWDVAVTMSGGQYIGFLKVTNHKIAEMRPIGISRMCEAVAAVDSNTLAVGYKHGKGIDMVDLMGRVLRQLNPTIKPSCLTANTEGSEVMCTWNYGVAKLRASDGREVYHKEVPQIKRPQGLTLSRHGLVVTDKSALHLLSSEGGYVAEMWRVPDGSAKSDSLDSVSMNDEICVCATKHGIVYVMNFV